MRSPTEKHVPLMMNAFEASTETISDPATRVLAERRARVLGGSYKLFYEQPVHVTHASGVHLFGADGTAYLDAYNNVPAVGHCHPKVVAAQARQAERLNTHTRYLNEVVIEYAERLIATFPVALSRVIFTCTGSEASDLALRIARYHTGGTGIVVTENAYHGLTQAVAEASPSLGDGVALGAHVRLVPAPDAYRSASEVGAEFGAHVERAIADLKRHGMRPAALIFDSVFSSDGIFTHPIGFIRQAVEAMRAAGGLYIADEVQPGFGRLGESMWGFERHGVVPDLVILGKPMGNGLPIGGVVAREETLVRFSKAARYFNTFGGNPVCCAAAAAVLDVIEDEQLIANAKKVGDAMTAGLRDLQRQFEVIGEVRGSGLFIGIDVVDARTAKNPNPALCLALVNELRRRRVLLSASGVRGHVLKIRPPLPFSLDNAQELMEKLALGLTALRAHGHPG